MTSIKDLKWCHAGAPGTIGARPDRAEEKVRGGKLHRVNSSPILEKIYSHGTRTGQLGKGGIAVETHNAGDGFTTLSVTCVDNYGLVHKVSSVLSDAKIYIVAATVVTHRRNDWVLATDKFKVVDSDTNSVVPEDQHMKLQVMIVKALEEHTGTSVHNKVREKDPLRRTQSDSIQQSSGSFSAVISTYGERVEVKSLLFEDDNPEVTTLHLTCTNQRNLLRDVSFHILANDFNIDSFILNNWDDGLCRMSFCLTDRVNRPLNAFAKTVLTNVLKVAASRSNSSDEVPKPMTPTQKSPTSSALSPLSSQRQSSDPSPFNSFCREQETNRNATPLDNQVRRSSMEILSDVQRMLKVNEGRIGGKISSIDESNISPLDKRISFDKMKIRKPKSYHLNMVVPVLALIVGVFLGTRLKS